MCVYTHERSWNICERNCLHSEQMRLSINSCCQAFTASVCVCVCFHAWKHGCLRLNSAASKSAQVWMRGALYGDTTAPYWLTLTQIWKFISVLCPIFIFFFPTCAVVCEQAFSKQNNFIATVNSTAFMRLNKNTKGFITVMKWIDGICELLTFTCLLAQWMSSKVNCVKPPLICSQRHGKDVGS